MNTASTRKQKDCNGKLLVCVRDACVSDALIYNQQDKGDPIPKAIIKVFSFDLQDSSAGCDPVAQGKTGDDGCIEFSLPGDRQYRLTFDALGYHGKSPAEGEESQSFLIKCNTTKCVDLTVHFGFELDIGIVDSQCNFKPICGDIVAGRAALVRIRHNHNATFDDLDFELSSDQGSLSSPRRFVDGVKTNREASFDTHEMQGPFTVSASFEHPDGSIISKDLTGMALRNVQNTSGNNTVSMTRTETEQTKDLSFWTVIRSSTEALSFTNYLQFMEALFCKKDNKSTTFFFQLPAEEKFGKLGNKRFLPFNDTDAYRVLKTATEAFVMVNCGVIDREKRFFNFALEQKDASDYLDGRDLPGGDLKFLFSDYVNAKKRDPMLPYLALIRSKLPEIPIMHASEEADLCFGFMREKLLSPCLMELIWSYWQEEGMLVQTMNAVTRRFQNVRSLAIPDPLANMEIDPLRPLNNLIWGYTQDEQHRLTVVRRNYEYDHSYGMRLEGKAVQNFRPVDTRSKFLEAYHHLLRLCTAFYKQDDDTTVKADAFPVLNALKEVHLILSEGAHGQFGDLPSTARIEMLMQQWLLARPEFREFLPTRLMVAYPEPWMDRVDAMKKLQGWTDTSVMHFRNLAMFGEQLLLSIRYGHWSDVYEPNQAFNWARFWRPQVQGYIHAYRAATGVELASETVDSGADATLPSVLLQKRLAMQHRGA
jgi:hypothetical protein